ncbi:universal stress protein [Streptomyces parvulus]|uniref:universal stress protein n=1 Tax=Streptomyces parvulus TaxID=146923 RepID=UPI001E28CE8E|nr:universal stress protein [Streptomyces parvulus]MCC9156355.1 universal stress protein [Streptomyces parvulus]MCE7688365.1 universal stress protein [Streptomyces parvulus]
MSESRPSSARVVVGVSGSPGSLAALVLGAAEARRRRAALWPVLAWEPPGGELPSRRPVGGSVLIEEWERLAGERLCTALDDVLGPGGAGVPTRALLARGVPGAVLVRIADREDDVLVVGAGRRGRLHRTLWPSVGRYCLAHAACPVLAVPPSPLQAALADAHRRNVWRLRLDTGRMARDFESVPPDA